MTEESVPGSDLEVRRLTLSFSGDDPAWFCEDPIMTAFINVLSVTFTVVEPLFIQVIRGRRAALSDPAQLEDVAGFIGQEAQHSKQHLAMNRWLRTLGYPIDEATAFMQEGYAELRARKSDDELLAFVSAFEHLTSVGSAYILRHTGVAARTDDAHVTLQWHCLEEVEHKSVCFDVFQTCVGDLSVRRRGMLTALMQFTRLGFPTFAMQLRGRRPFSPSRWRAWAELTWMTFAVYFSALDYMRADFHPSHADDSDLLGDWRRRYPAIAARA